MKKSVLLCDVHEDQFAVESVTIRTLTEGSRRLDLCRTCYDRLNSAIGKLLATPAPKEEEGKKSSPRPGIRTGIVDAVRNVLHSDPSHVWSAREVAEVADVTPGQAQAALANLCQAKEATIERVARGRYAWKEKGSTHAPRLSAAG